MHFKKRSLEYGRRVSHASGRVAAQGAVVLLGCLRATEYMLPVAYWVIKRRYILGKNTKKNLSECLKGTG